MINLTPYTPYMPLRIDGQLAIVGRTSEGAATLLLCKDLKELEELEDMFTKQGVPHATQ